MKRVLRESCRLDRPSCACMHILAVCLHVLTQTLIHPVHGDYKLSFRSQFPRRQVLRLGMKDKGNVYRVRLVESQGKLAFLSERCTEMVLFARVSPCIPCAFRDAYTNTYKWTTAEGRNYCAVLLYCYTARLLDSKPHIAGPMTRTWSVYSDRVTKCGWPWAATL